MFSFDLLFGCIRTQSERERPVLQRGARVLPSPQTHRSAAQRAQILGLSCLSWSLKLQACLNVF